MTRLTLVVLLHLYATTPMLGAENPVVEGSIATISSDAWTISGFDSTIELTAAGLSGEFRIGRIVLTESGRVFDEVRIGCALLSLTNRSVDCAQATFTATLPGISRQTVSGAFKYDRRAGDADIQLSDVSIAGGQVRFDVHAGEEGFNVRYAGTNLQLGAVFELAGRFSDVFSAYSAGGIADVSGTLKAPANGPLRVVLTASIDGASIANDAGTIAADGVKGTFDLDVTFDPGGTTIALLFNGSRGEAYLEPVYANFSEHAFSLQAEEIVTPDFAVFDVRHFSLQQESLLDVQGSTTLRFPEDNDAGISITADLVLHDTSVSTLYTSFVQIPLAGTLFGNLETDGRVSGSIRLTENALSAAALQLDNLNLDDRRGRFAIYGLSGTLNWSADDNQQPAASQLRWDSAAAYNITVGGGEANLQLGDNDLEMLAPLRIATMGGALLVNQLALHDFGSDAATGALDAELEPIQLGQLTGAFGWPAFSGTLSGRLPLLQLADNTITVGGKLSASAFDGTIEISELRIEQPFGRVPRMQSELTFRDLDLQRVTEAFSFGLIQGRLSGDVSGLELQNWRPVAMDMHFYTPPDDKTQHRISQQAVENLANVGGGGAAAILSTGFLRFFEVFAYDRIGLRCLLRNGACAMSGAGQAKAGPQGQGYYIVKGRGIPRIDVVGYRDTVSWPRLVQQLVAITQSGAPTVN
jgi:hypothetical protein